MIAGHGWTKLADRTGGATSRRTRLLGSQRRLGNEASKEGDERRDVQAAGWDRQLDPYGGRRLCSGVGSEATTEEGIVSREKAEPGGRLAGKQDDRRAGSGGLFPAPQTGEDVCAEC